MVAEAFRAKFLSFRGLRVLVYGDEYVIGDSKNPKSPHILAIYVVLISQFMRRCK